MRSCLRVFLQKPAARKVWLVGVLSLFQFMSEANLQTVKVTAAVTSFCSQTGTEVVAFHQ